jgi:hypothetical protein
MARPSALPVFLPPAVAAAVSIAVMLGPGREREVHAARIYGLPTRGATMLALRSECLTHRSGRLRPATGTPLRLTLHRGAGDRGWSGRSDEAGIAEARIELGSSTAPGRDHTLGEASELELTVGDGEATRHVLTPVTPPLPLPAVANGEEDADGKDVAISIELPRGQLLAEFPEALRVELRVARGDGAPVLRWSATGGDVAGAEPLRLGCDEHHCRHRYDLTLTAKAPTVELELHGGGEAQNGDTLPDDTLPNDAALRRRVRWPVALGRLWLDPAAKKPNVRRIGAAIPKDEAFASLLGPHGRLWGARVRMRSDARSFSWGELRLPMLPDGPLALQLASEVSEASGHSVSWPLEAGRRGMRATPLRLLVDSLPAAIAAENQRRAGARRLAYATSGGALLLLLVQLAYALRRPPPVPVGDRKALAHAPVVGWPQLVLLVAGLGLLMWLVAASSGHG